MNKTILLLLPLVLLGSCNDSEKKPSTITISGEGKIRVKPDLVILTIDVSFVQPRMVDAVRLSQQTVDSVVDILSRFGNKQNNIKTSRTSTKVKIRYVKN